jgi:hypothetical protein
MHSLIQLKKAAPVFLLVLLLAYFALPQSAQAVSPPPDGGYPGQNTAEGHNALFNLSPTDGGFNTAIGWLSLFANTTGSFNTGVGAGTLFLNTSHNNTAVGAGALTLNTTGDGNTANGAFALVSNTVGRGNTAVGAATLVFNTAGAGNTAVGTRALLNNAGGPTESSLNTAVGLDALTANTTGNGNTAVGAGPGVTDFGTVPAALASNTIGNGNTAVGAAIGAGAAALGSNTIGNGNTAVGAGTLFSAGALGSNTTGGENTAIGQRALNSNTTGSDNIAVGDGAGANLTTGSNNIDIGNGGVAEEANTVRIGTSGTQTATYIAGISGATASGGVAVFVNPDGKLGTVTSSRRFKDDIKPMGKASETLFALKPVSFRYKKEIDQAGTPQLGLVAEEVEKVNPDLVVRDKEGKPYSVRYDQVNAMLLNEFLKEHRKVEQQAAEIQEQKATIAELKSNAARQEATAAHQQKQIEALTTGLQRVSAQLEASKPAPQVVNNP